jgi:hypothetical protein
MDFEDYALAGLGTAGGLALGGKVVGQHLGNKWGEQGYYRSKASSLGTQSDADIEYQQAAQQIANSELPPKLKTREIEKLQLQRQRVVGKSLQNMERDAENSRGWNRGKGIVAGTLGTAAVGGALGLGYGLSNDFKRSDKKITKFTRKHNSTYVQFKKAYNQAVANFIDPSAIASEGIGDYLGLGLGSLAGAEIGRAGSAQIKAKALRRSADPNERHNQMLAAQLEAAQQIQDPLQRTRAIEKAQSQADYESAKLQRWAGLKGGLLQAGYTGLGATTGLLGNTIAHHWNN